MARLKEQYVNEIAPALNSKFGYKSVMQIPKLDKVVINVACGEAKDNEKILEAVMKDLGQITGSSRRLYFSENSVFPHIFFSSSLGFRSRSRLNSEISFSSPICLRI